MATALVYHPEYLEHDTGNHPERAERLTAIRHAIEQQGLTDALVEITPNPAPIEAVRQVHGQAYLSALQAFCERGGGHLTLDTVAGERSFDVALLAAGGAMAAVDHALGESAPAFAALRPPGHHCTRDQAMGFCLLNHAAIAAVHAASEWGVRRVFIFDWDLHHGNGTEQIFYDSPAVLYCSIHEYPAYPGTGASGDIGKGAGTGYTINVPLPPRSGDLALMGAMSQIVTPVLTQYEPELVICSAGFDGHHRDPLGDLNYTFRGLDQMVRSLVDAVDRLCPGRIAVLLEGGYDLEAVGTGSALVLARLAGCPLDLPVEPVYDLPPAGWQPNLDRSRQAAARFWPL